MIHLRLDWRGIIGLAGIAAFPLLLGAIATLQGIPLTISAVLARLLFVAVLLVATLAARRQPQLGWAIVGVDIIAGAIYAATRATLAAWVLLATFYALLFWLDALFVQDARKQAKPNKRFRVPVWSWWLRIAYRAVLALTAGLLPVALVQIETHFADEEFFVALQVFALAMSWLLFNALLWLVSGARSQEPGARSTRHSPLVILSSCHLIILLAIIVTTARAYQRSFFSLDAPTYAGISAASPFLCGSTAAAPETFNGAEVFSQLITRIAANPYKQLPEYGMLALGTGATQWRTAFRTSLLQEAQTARFTGPADSVKSVQGEAALRVYYYVLLHKQFPDLFSADDDRALHQWFAAINRRAQTVEWVDWMYALAFDKAPEGPYENQENGAGLLALLEANGLGDPALAAQNRAYLARNVRGWAQRFRNTDDTAIYQPEWIRNALFQASYTGQAPPDQMRRSFEWLLLQMPPDMSVVRYNHPYGVSPLGVGALGAVLLNDPRYEWLAGQALAHSIAKGDNLSALTGVTHAAQLNGTAPTEGSCLLYGDSGIPTARGPLAPDKLVFRDGWSDDASYLLVNLRFSGWHRYKATGTLMSLEQNGPLLGEVTDGKPIAWLPTGRSIFRDKRIPRENLNGLVVERTGMSAVLNTLTTFGGQWAQDPPYYARVERFSTAADRDSAQIVLDDWHGWRQRRTITFVHNGPIIIEDTAAGPAGSHAALLWHPTAGGALQNERVQLRAGASPAEMLVLPVHAGAIQTDSTGTMQYNASSDGQLHTVTVFLTRSWVGAQAQLAQGNLQLTHGAQQITLPLATSNGQ